jgi:hypothetical protein
MIVKGLSVTLSDITDVNLEKILTRFSASTNKDERFIYTFSKILYDLKLIEDEYKRVILPLYNDIKQLTPADSINSYNNKLARYYDYFLKEVPKIMQNYDNISETLKWLKANKTNFESIFAQADKDFGRNFSESIISNLERIALKRFRLERMRQGVGNMAIYSNFQIQKPNFIPQLLKKINYNETREVLNMGAKNETEEYINDFEYVTTQVSGLIKNVNNNLMLF